MTIFFTPELSSAARIKIPIVPPLQKGDDRGRNLTRCAALSDSFLAGPLREADQGGKGKFLF
jgi:hypothetical protein